MMNDDEAAATATDDLAKDREREAALARAEAVLDDEGDRPSPERLAEVGALGEQVVEALKTVFDPEIPVNIYELGLVYRIDIEDDNRVVVDMTLTSPHCPVAESLPGEVSEKVKAVDGVSDAEVRIVWDPPWNPSMMTEEAQLELGMIY
jgi:FeS assembly SUF system protein